MESKVWVINDPDTKEAKPKQKPKSQRVYLIAIIIMLISAGSYFVYRYMFAGSAKVPVNRAINVPNTDAVKVAQSKEQAKKASKKVYTAEDIMINNEKLLTLDDVSRKITQVAADSQEEIKSRPVCPNGYETIVVKRVYLSELYCYSPEKSFLLWRRTLDEASCTVVDYIYDGDKKGSFKQITRHYLLNGEKIAKREGARNAD